MKSTVSITQSAGTNTLIRFCFSRNNVEFGPCSAEDLRELVKKGQLSSNDLVWKVGSRRKLRVAEVSWLSRLEQPGLEASSVKPIPVSESQPSNRTANHAHPTHWLLAAFVTTITFVGLLITHLLKTVQGKDSLDTLRHLWPKEPRERGQLIQSMIISSMFLAVGGSVLSWSHRVTSQSFSSPSGFQFARFSPTQFGTSDLQRIQQDAEQRSLTWKEEREEKARQAEIACRELVDKGRSLLSSDKIHAAKTTMEQAVQQFPSTAEAYVGLADVYFRRDEPAEGISTLWRAVGHAANRPELRIELLVQISSHCLEHEDYSGAIKAMENAIQLKPEEGAYRFAAGVASLKGKKYQQAISYFEAALEYFELAGLTGTWEYKARNHMATAYQSLGKTDAAVSLCDRVLADDPGNLDALCVRGLIYAQSNDPQAALEHLRIVAAMPECELAVLTSYAQAFQDTQQWSAAVEAGTLVMQKEPADGRWVFRRAFSEMRAGRFDLAQSDCDTAMRMAGEDQALRNSVSSLRETLATLLDRRMTYDDLIKEQEMAEMERAAAGDAAIFGIGNSGWSSGAPAHSGSGSTGSGSTYDYLTPHQAGKLGAMGIRIVPGHYFQR
ncbi:MAG: tetratricopeptide repeat protein [Planctomyces sp.]|nr:tetratricopeptide repeat protein [Planctomyces sp.]